MSPLQKRRLEYRPPIPELLSRLDRVCLRQEGRGGGSSDERLRERFPKTFDRRPFLLVEGEAERRPLRIGAVFSGGPASGGHNVLIALMHAAKACHPQSQVYGFFNGPSGVIENRKKELLSPEIASYFNQGGFDCIGSGRTKIETAQQLEDSLRTCQQERLDGLVIIGGDDSNTNAAVLTEYFLDKGCSTQVVGVPKTIDGDLRSPDVEISFGFDSACKTYAEIIGNIARDALSARKYYHFIKLMGRSASHIVLECALATQPNLALIGEERRSLRHVVEEIADLVERRSEAGKDYGLILIPEGLVEFLPEMHALIASLNELLAKGQAGDPGRIAEQLAGRTGSSSCSFRR